jgi:hypothetical protein
MWRDIVAKDVSSKDFQNTEGYVFGAHYKVGPQQDELSLKQVHKLSYVWVKTKRYRTWALVICDWRKCST